MKKKHFSFSICMPVYKGSQILTRALDSVFKQKFSDYEIIIGDDNPLQLKTEINKTQEIIRSYRSKKIRYFKNKKNLGYPRNLKKIVSKAKKDVVFLLAQDDILSKNALQETHDAFFLADDIGAVTRPYFWFYKKINQPVRSVEPPSTKKNLVMSIFKDQAEFMKIFESLGQLSGLAYRRKYLSVPFNEDIFPAHIYPFAGILRKYRCVFLKNYTIAVGIEDSQTRAISSIYNQSPTASWLKMYKSVFAGNQYQQQRQWGIEHMSTNFEGLVQIKNYSHFKFLLREIAVMLKARWQNIINVRFWFYALITLIVPRFFLRKLTDWYKAHILSKTLPNIKFKQ